MKTGIGGAHGPYCIRHIGYNVLVSMLVEFAYLPIAFWGKPLIY